MAHIFKKKIFFISFFYASSSSVSRMLFSSSSGVCLRCLLSILSLRLNPPRPVHAASFFSVERQLDHYLRHATKKAVQNRSDAKIERDNKVYIQVRKSYLENHAPFVVKAQTIRKFKSYFKLVIQIFFPPHLAGFSLASH